MKILLVTATANEMDSLPEPLGLNKRTHKITRLVTGPGIMNTALELGKTLSKETFDIAINFGIAGSFHKMLKPGMVVHVTSEMLTDFGAEDSSNFLTIFDLGLYGKNDFPYTKGMLLNTNEFKSDTLKRLPSVKGSTVNTVHGKKSSIQKVSDKFHPAIESMEGAVFFYACMMEKLPFIQIRAISNLVERRNRKVWQMPKALENLGLKVSDILKEITE